MRRRWCQTTREPYPWLNTMREVERDCERGIAPKLPDGWRPPMWADLLGYTARTRRQAGHYEASYRARLHAQGLCILCRELVEVCGDWRCAKCAGRNAETHRERRARFKAAGLCQQCGQRAPAEGRVQCPACLDRLAARARRTRAAKRSALCVECRERPRTARHDWCRECCERRAAEARAEATSCGCFS